MRANDREGFPIKRGITKQFTKHNCTINFNNSLLQNLLNENFGSEMSYILMLVTNNNYHVGYKNNYTLYFEYPKMGICDECDDKLTNKK